MVERINRMVLGGLVGLAILAGGVPQAAVGDEQDAQAPRQRGGRRTADSSAFNSPLFWNAEQIMQSIVGQIARQYNLSEQQEQYTRLLMTQRVKRFLGEHEREVRSLMAEYWQYQFSGQLPPTSAVEEFGRRARPLLAAIHEEIVDGNMQWRDILDDTQRDLHDRDLQAIDEAFKRFDEQFERWSRGEVRPTDFPGRVGPEPRRVMNAEDAWQYYVRIFIQNYQLDAGQAEAARSVLREMRTEAAAYREARQNAFEALEADYAELAAAEPKRDPEALAAARDRRKELDERRQSLEAPIAKDMFERLKRQLDMIPRADQRRAHNERQARLDRIAERTRSQVAARLAPTTQPATDTAPAPEVPETQAAVESPAPEQSAANPQE